MGRQGYITIITTMKMAFIDVCYVLATLLSPLDVYMHLYQCLSLITTLGIKLYNGHDYPHPTVRNLGLREAKYLPQILLLK